MKLPRYIYVMAAFAVLVTIGLGGCVPWMFHDAKERQWDTTVVSETADGDFTVNDIQSAPYMQRYYYQQLTDEQQTQYRRLYTAIITHSPVATYKGNYNEAMQDVTRSVLLDNPEIFYVRSGGMFESTDLKTDYSIEYVYDAPTMYEMRPAIEQSVALALDYITSTAGVASQAPMTYLNGIRMGNPHNLADEEKHRVAWVINSMLAYVITYDRDAAAVSDDEFYKRYYNTNTLYGALVEGKAMCGGYAQAFAYFCYQLGIPCVYVEGNVEMDDFHGAHAWNLVQLEEGWRNVDPTWSDDEQGVGLTDKYYLVTDDVHNQYVTEFYVPCDIPSAA